MIDRNQFWKIIDEARNSTSKLTDVPDWLKAFLKEKPLQDVLDFERHYIDLFVEAYDARLWRAAGLTMDFCSDDTFMDFRYWLIAQGRSAFEQVLNTPDSLADLNLKSGDYASPLLFYFGGVARKVYQERTGEFEIPLDYSKCHHPNLQLLNKEFMNLQMEKLSSEFPKLYAQYDDRRSKLPKYEPIFKPCD
jgi:hypothetical protein